MMDYLFKSPACDSIPSSWKQATAKLACLAPVQLPWVVLEGDSDQVVHFVHERTQMASQVHPLDPFFETLVAMLQQGTSTLVDVSHSSSQLPIPQADRRGHEAGQATTTSHDEGEAEAGGVEGEAGVESEAGVEGGAGDVEGETDGQAADAAGSGATTPMMEAVGIAGSENGVEADARVGFHSVATVGSPASSTAQSNAGTSEHEVKAATPGTCPLFPTLSVLQGGLVCDARLSVVIGVF